MVPNTLVTVRASDLTIHADRWRPAVPFVVVGSACVVAGGIVAAATAHSPSEHASWAVAYLVLVGGVAQLALALGQALFATDLPSRRAVTWEFAAWNLGNAAVLVGTLLDLLLLTDVGGALLVLTLALLVRAVRGARPSWPLRLYRLLVVVVLVSIPIGLVLARMGPS